MAVPNTELGCKRKRIQLSLSLRGKTEAAGLQETDGAFLVQHLTRGGADLGLEGQRRATLAGLSSACER